MTTLFHVVSLCLCAARQDSAPVSALPPPPVWEKLRAAYDYNSRILTVVKETKQEDDTHLRTVIAFTDPFGLRVTGILVRPKEDGVYPCVLLLHGSGGRKENMAGRFGVALAEQGIASLALDAALHGDRKGQGQPTGEVRGKLGAVTRITVVDYRIALDFLAARKDLDNRRVGVLGYSMGSQMGAILAAVDTRICATLLYVGCDPVRMIFLPQTPLDHREEIEMVSPSNFIGHISPRSLYMVNGRSDTNISADMTKLLYDAAKDPKEIVWFDAGHGLSPAAIDKGLDWLTGRLAAKTP